MRFFYLKFYNQIFMEYGSGFIHDAMNAFERNVKRIGDYFITGVLLIVFRHYLNRNVLINLIVLFISTSFVV